MRKIRELFYFLKDGNNYMERNCARLCKAEAWISDLQHQIQNLDMHSQSQADRIADLERHKNWLQKSSQVNTDGFYRVVIEIVKIKKTLSQVESSVVSINHDDARRSDDMRKRVDALYKMLREKSLTEFGLNEDWELDLANRLTQIEKDIDWLKL